MIQNILTARAVYRVPTREAYVAAHLQTLARQRDMGIDARPHIDETALVARIDHGRWLVDCPCGSGVAVDPDWDEARCFACGSVYPHVVFPAGQLRARIETTLRLRPLSSRNWRPTESVDVLIAENIEHGLRGPS